MSRTPEPPATVEAYLSAYLQTVEHGDEPPSRESLDAASRAEVEEILQLLAGQAGTPPDATETADDDLDLPPLAESDFAVEHGLIRAAPDVVVAGEAVERGRTTAGLSSDEIAREMTSRGYTTDAAAVAEIEGSDTYLLRPREARLLAALLDLPLAGIEARAEPWPATGPELASLVAAGAAPVVVGQDVVVRTATGDDLGLLRCPGGAFELGSRTYRAAAAALLTGGRWRHLTGALLVTATEPHLAVAVDALDCVTRTHAPTGLAGFSRLAEPASIGEAVAAYERTYTVAWSDPEPLARLDALGTMEDVEDEVDDGDDSQGHEPSGDSANWLADGLREVAEQLRREARRSRIPGKGPGCQRAARWFDAVEPTVVVDLLTALAATGSGAEPGAASAEALYEQLREVLPA